jgi:predicted SAM-dependent methyltransferase
LYKEGWVNIDLDKSLKTDICSDFMAVHDNFQFNSVKAITMIHSISYLNLWEARLFFKNMYDLLVQRGVLELEFPDVVKCGRALSSTKNAKHYIEAIRGVYAFDLDQINNQENFTTYSFGWSAWFIKLELEKVGFRDIRILRPLTHGRRNWRDTRIIAIK